MGFQKIIIILIFFFCLNEVFSKDNLDRKIPPPEPYNKEHLLKSGGSGIFFFFGSGVAKTTQGGNLFYVK